ncbi:MAG: RnfABCDGE type electron transport complex subunit G [Lawsonibacter sp.]
MSNWNKIAKPIVVLCVICIVITGALAVTNNATAPIIAEATRVAQEQARKELLPDADNFTKVEGIEAENVSDIYVADNGVGTVITCTAKGYGGTITVMVAFSPDDTVSRIKITEQSETAGLGAKISTDKEFQNSFSGLPAEDFTVTDINAISGATISSKAVTAAVNAAIDAYNQIA